MSNDGPILQAGETREEMCQRLLGYRSIMVRAESSTDGSEPVVESEPVMSEQEVELEQLESSSLSLRLQHHCVRLRPDRLWRGC